MGLLSSDLRVELDEKKSFQPGDFITGTVILSNSSDVKVQNIDVMLRCTELTHTRYWTGFALTYRPIEVFNRNRVYSYRQTLFPEESEKSGIEPPLFWGTRQWKPHNTWNDDFQASFTIEPGTHAFRFELEVPPGFPPSLRASFSNNIEWKVSAKMFKGTSLSLADEAHELIDVRNNEAVTLSPDDVERIADPRPVNVYHHGSKHEERVKLSVEFPRQGLVQAPNNLGIVLGIDGDAIEELLLTHVELELKRKVTTTVKPLSRRKRQRHWQERHDVFRDTNLIYTRDLNLPCSEGLAAVNDDLHKDRLDIDAVESFDSKCFNVSYKLVVKVTVSPRAKPSDKQKLRLSVPIKVNSKFADVRRLFVSADRVTYNDLPMYEA